MDTKLNDLAATSVLEAADGTFEAVRAFCATTADNAGPRVVVATLAAALAEGIGEFVSPVLPRGLRLSTADEVAAADLDVQVCRVTPAEVGDPDLIVSGHAGTREVLVERFPCAAVFEGNISPEDVEGKVVAGTLPPHLVSAAAGYIPATVRDFDYSRDGDLSGEELLARLVIGDAVKVTVS